MDQIRLSKIFPILAILSTMALGGRGYAFDLSASYQYTIYNNSELEPSAGCQVEISHKRLSLISSYESTLLRLVGQEAVDIRLFGIGLGFKLKDFFEIGALYYFPETKEKGNAFREGMWLYINHIYPEGKKGSYLSQDVYSYELYNGLGGYAKVRTKYQVTDNLNFSFSAAYRYLRLKECFIRDHKEYDPGSWVEFFYYRDFSSMIILASIEWRF